MKWKNFSSCSEFRDKSFAYLLFNLAQKNSYKVDKSPLGDYSLPKPDCSVEIVNLPPAFLDELFVQYLDKKRQGEYHIIPHPFKCCRATRTRSFALTCASSWEPNCHP